MTNPNVRDISVNASSMWIKSIDPQYTGVYMDGMLLLIFGGIPWQVYFQRVLSAKSAFNAKILSYVAAVGCVVMAIPSILIGAIATNTGTVLALCKDIYFRYLNTLKHLYAYFKIVDCICTHYRLE